jgi:hypothetical protein
VVGEESSKRQGMRVVPSLESLCCLPALVWLLCSKSKSRQGSQEEDEEESINPLLGAIAKTAHYTEILRRAWLGGVGCSASASACFGDLW